VISMLALPSNDIGYVVSDPAQPWPMLLRDSGAGPFYVAEHMYFEKVTFRREPAVFDHSSVAQAV
jgi:hypothetical protein